MASKNSKDFSDPYTLIYGHHMENGSMFGNIMKFKDKEFFDKNDKGVLILENKVYDLKIIACVETSAYDSEIYNINKSTDSLPAFVDYIKSKSKYYRECNYEKLLALSTCDNAVTAGRTILICAMTTRKHPLPDREYGETIPHREPVGHPMAGAYWAIINLLILIANIILAYKYTKINKFKTKKTFIIIGLALISILIFCITENFKSPMQMVDVWTPLMILIYFFSFLIIREKKPSKNEDQDSNSP
jgi:sortase B